MEMPNKLHLNGSTKQMLVMKNNKTQPWRSKLWQIYWLYNEHKLENILVLNENFYMKAFKVKTNRWFSTIRYNFVWLYM